MLILSYFLNAIALTFVSWTIGLLLNNAIKKTNFYSLISNFSFVKSTSLNKTLGLNLFGWIIKNSFFKVFNQKLKFEKIPTVEDLQQIRKEMVYAEVGHIIGFIFLLFVIIYQIINANTIYVIILFVFNIVFNLYPILLQQYNKKRIDRILKQ